MSGRNLTLHDTPVKVHIPFHAACSPSNTVLAVVCQVLSAIVRSKCSNGICRFGLFFLCAANKVPAHNGNRDGKR